MRKDRVNSLKAQSYGPSKYASGANPDFQVTSASRKLREMDLLLQKIDHKSALLDRKMAALDRVPRVSRAVKQEPDPVLIEPLVDPAPKVDPASGAE